MRPNSVKGARECMSVLRHSSRRRTADCHATPASSRPPSLSAEPRTSSTTSSSLQGLSRREKNNSSRMTQRVRPAPLTPLHPIIRCATPRSSSSYHRLGRKSFPDRQFIVPFARTNFRPLRPRPPSALLCLARPRGRPRRRVRVHPQSRHARAASQRFRETHSQINVGKGQPHQLAHGSTFRRDRREATRDRVQVRVRPRSS